MALSVKQVDAAKSKKRIYRLSDGDGLYLEVPPQGTKRWRLRYRFGGKEKMLSLGTYPEVSLKTARDKRNELRALIQEGTDPSLARQEEQAIAAGHTTFEYIAREWHEQFKVNWTDGHATTNLSRLENNVFPWIGKKAITEITSPEILRLLRRIESRGAIETAHRVRGLMSRVFRFAIASGRADRDPAGDLQGALPPAKSKHFPTITKPQEIAALLRAIDGYTGNLITKCALKLAPLLFVRPGELRHACWSEIDLNIPEWRIPGEKMKMSREHIVPLSRQAREILEELYPMTGSGKYVFPSIRTTERPMSENTINAGLRRLGYGKEEMTGHGFRSMASTRLNEMGWNPDAIELQLAHVEGNEVRAAYNRAKYLDIRIKMMQAWADYLDSLKHEDNVTPIFAAS